MSEAIINCSVTLLCDGDSLHLEVGITKRVEINGMSMEFFPMSGIKAPSGRNLQLPYIIENFAADSFDIFIKSHKDYHDESGLFTFYGKEAPDLIIYNKVTSRPCSPKRLSHLSSLIEEKVDHFLVTGAFMFSTRPEEIGYYPKKTKFTSELEVVIVTK